MYYEIPEHTKAALDRYVNDRLPPGGFLTAVLTNDLTGAVTRADDINRRHLPEIVGYLFNECPASCWGNQQRVEAWLSNE